MKKAIYKNGFSLIELLIVIAVVALVMTVLFPNFMGIRQRARDSQRKADVANIQKAFEIYKMDQSPQTYPANMPAVACGGCWSSSANCQGNIYMRKMPCDPAGPAPTYIYVRGTDPLTYNLTACLENLVDPNKDSTLNPSCSTGASYTINEP